MCCIHALLFQIILMLYKSNKQDYCTSKWVTGHKTCFLWVYLLPSSKNKTIKDFGNHWILTGLDVNHCKPSVILGTRVISPKTWRRKNTGLYIVKYFFFCAQQPAIKLFLLIMKQNAHLACKPCDQMKPWLFSVTYQMKPDFVFFCLNKVSHK